MDEPNRNNRIAKNLSTAIHLQPVYVAVLYALLAFGNGLLYWQGSPFEVLGFTDDPIGWWAIATVLLTITFCVLAIRIELQRRLYSANLHQQPRPFRRSTILLVVLSILFTVPNVFIAFLHVNGIRAGFAYWGQVRAAYEVPFFHLLPMLLLLYWWLSSLGRKQAVTTPYTHPLPFIKGRSELIGASSSEEVADMKSTLTDWCHVGILFLGGCSVLVYLTVSISRLQVSHSMNGGITVVTDFTALYFYVIGCGTLLGLLVAIGMVVYWRWRLHLLVDANCFFATNAGFIRFTLWWLPLLVAVVGAFSLAFYLQQT